MLKLKDKPIVNLADAEEYQAAREKLRNLQDQRPVLNRKLDTTVEGNNAHDRTAAAARAMLNGEPVNFPRDAVEIVRFEIATNEAVIALLSDRCRVLRADAVGRIVEGRRAEYVEVIARIAAATDELVSAMLAEKQFVHTMPHDALPLLPRIIALEPLLRELQNFQDTLLIWSK
jgi:hypothetical protein